MNYGLYFSEFKLQIKFIFNRCELRKSLIYYVYTYSVRNHFSSFIKSNRRSEDSYTGIADFFCFFFQEKVIKLVRVQF